jgi:hypothetical protein
MLSLLVCNALLDLARGDRTCEVGLQHIAYWTFSAEAEILLNRKIDRLHLHIEIDFRASQIAALWLQMTATLPS